MRDGAIDAMCSAPATRAESAAAAWSMPSPQAWISAGSSPRPAAGGDAQLAPRSRCNQCDIRELQLAKGAIAAGLRILLEQWGAA